jgi:hypothetical protein
LFQQFGVTTFLIKTNHFICTAQAEDGKQFDHCRAPTKNKLKAAHNTHSTRPTHTKSSHSRKSLLIANTLSSTSQNTISIQRPRRKARHTHE